jgi:hypothetical protein
MGGTECAALSFVSMEEARQENSPPTKGSHRVPVALFAAINAGILIAMYGCFNVAEGLGGWGQAWEGSSHLRSQPQSPADHLRQAMPTIIRFWAACLLYSIVVPLLRKKVDRVSAIGFFVFVATFLLELLVMSISDR